ncbi:Mur ligase family protein [Cysteiniphilum sp. QT6929]|uniref:bifunctional folylpolyglutamate synthase/dihydrofolate synthase n=1 Tax=Cysteiniphilum sp. QT6929 TaxID=2975055 RepID=UPI0024B359EB|nr:Mur ligase family protein [Cysteiniphilum sp. QT6929]WHN65410.1 Mur ligase family protein [Cysteiniphilum sp. QT6929]
MHNGIVYTQLSQRIEQAIDQITSLDFPQATLNDLKLFLKRLNINYVPHIITVTGTNGKGSTVAILSHILQHNAIDHICHTSPHIRFFNERISYNQQPISNYDLLNYLQQIYSLCLALEIKLHYHFISFVSTWLYIQAQKPKYAILEVGVGGRLDPANLFDADIAIITTVALDHCEMLGNTIEEIALEKAHIARAKKPVIIGDNFPKSALDYLHQINATVIYAKHDSNINNAFIHPNSMNCALTAIKHFDNTLLLPNDLGSYRVAGRFQIIQDKPLMIADVAHNPQAVAHFFTQVKSLLMQTPKTRVLAIFSANQHKDITNILECGDGFVDQWLIPDLSIIDPRFSPLTNQHKNTCFPNNSIFFDNATAAFDYITANAHADDLVIVFGSFVLIGELNKYMDKITASQ